MKITSIRIKKLSNHDRVLGIADVEFDNCLVIHDIKLVKLKDKRILSFPSKRMQKYTVDSDDKYVSNFEYSDLIHPSTKEFRAYIETEVFKIYDTKRGVSEDE